MERIKTLIDLSLFNKRIYAFYDRKNKSFGYTIFTRSENCTIGKGKHNIKLWA